MVALESLENPFIIPLLMNCRIDNPELISSHVPHSIRENGTFIIDINSLENRKDVFCDDNGAWVMKGNREKMYAVTKNMVTGQVTSLQKVPSGVIYRCEDAHMFASPVQSFIKPL